MGLVGRLGASRLPLTIWKHVLACILANNAAFTDELFAFVAWKLEAADACRKMEGDTEEIFFY